MKNFQRNGSISNAHVGKDFVDLAKVFFSSKGIDLDLPGQTSSYTTAKKD